MTGESAERPCPSSPAHAGDPVRRGLWVVSLASLDTGSPAPVRIAQKTGADSRRYSRGALRPQVCIWLAPRRRGRGEDRVRAAPAVSQACCKEICCPRAYRFSWQHAGLPDATALRLIRVRPGDRLSCHHHRQRLSPRHDLTPAPGRQGLLDFTVRFCHARQSQPSRPSHPTARS
jgi:hypothetical protein